MIASTANASGVSYEKLSVNHLMLLMNDREEKLGERAVTDTALNWENMHNLLAMTVSRQCPHVLLVEVG
jgi:hypothetical protein